MPPLRALRRLAVIALPLLVLAGCSMGNIRPAPSVQAAIAAIAPDPAPPARATPVGHVPDAAAVPRAPSSSALAFAGGGEVGLDGLIAHYSTEYDVPERLVRRVIVRESNYNAGARNGPYWGLMQIRHDTAQGMGYRGSANGLLDAETNLRYAVRYLAGAYVTSGGNEDRAYRLYASGYYYDAKRAGLLEASGLR